MGAHAAPEFKNFELALTRWASYCAAAFFVFAGVLQLTAPQSRLGWLCDFRVAWVELVLMSFAWVGVKFHTVLFREFYTLKPDDDLVLVGLRTRIDPRRLAPGHEDEPPKPGAAEPLSGGAAKH